jgi:phenylalanyl-tRNA synthetase beta chain
MIADNLRYKSEFRIFELSRTYHKENSKAVEKSQLIMASVNEDFRELQGVAENMGLIIKPNKNTRDQQHPGRNAALMLRGQQVGSLYELHPQIATNFGIKTQVVIAEVEIEMIHAMNIDHQPKYVTIPKYPAMELDVSILIPKRELAEVYFNAIKKTDHTLIKDIQLIDEYYGQNIDKNKRSLTYSIQYRSDNETLTEDQVMGIHKRVIENLKAKGAVIRD